MKKSYLLSTGNDGYRYRYEFEKINSFSKIFTNFMRDLGFDDSDRPFLTMYEGEDEKEMDIEKTLDFTWNFRNKSFDVDLFIGGKKIILVVRTKDKMRLADVAIKHLNFKKEL